MQSFIIILGCFFLFIVGVNLKDVVYILDCIRLVVVNFGVVILNFLFNIFIDFEGLVIIIIRNDQGFFIEINMDFIQLNDR